MKKLILTLAVLTLTACENPSDTSTSSTTTPTPSQPDQTTPVVTPVVSITPVTTPASPTVTPTPSPSPVVTPAPAPSPAPAPTPTSAPSVPNNAVKTSSFGGYTCALMSTGYIWCSDGTNAVTTPQGNFVDVVVGQGAVCALQRQQTPIVTQLPQNCSYLSDASCTRPSTYYGTYCWSGNAQGPVAMRTQSQTYAQVQASGLSTWMTGPTSIGRDPTSNKACINQGVYDLHSNPQSRLTQTITLCGSTVTTNGYLQ